MELILLRHPPPLAPPGACYGRSDIGVAAEVLADAGRTLPLHPMLAGALRRGVPVISSPLQRCTLLAALLAPGYRTDARLAEMDFGSWELRPWDDIPRAEVDAWAADTLHYRPGGGESVLAMAGRVQSFLHEQHDKAIVVCHAGTIRLMLALAAGGTLAGAARRAAGAAHKIPFLEPVQLPLRG